jgi:DNA-binding HxlR family transcriptional regulator
MALISRYSRQPALVAWPPKVEYTITDLGLGLRPILEAIVEWGLTGVHEEILAKTPQRWPEAAHP